MAEQTEGFRGRRVTTCNFCGKSSRDVGPMIEGPGDVYICAQCVDLAQNIVLQEKRKSGRATGSIPSPRSIHELLEAYIVGQQHPKRALSVAIHNHLRRVATPTGSVQPSGEVEIGKRNVLLIGPTGCGKTRFGETLARVLEVPFVIGDAATLMQAESYGHDVLDLLLKLLQNAEYDLEAAQRGIVYIDNIDAVAGMGNGGPRHETTSPGVQRALVEVLDGVVANISPRGGRQESGQQCVQIDTREIQFICAGTPDVTPQFVARFPIVVTLDPPDLESLINILTEPKDALVKQYQALFRRENAELEFTRGALEMIAQRAFQRDSGAHALSAVCEEILLDLMYRLPDEPGGKYVITEDFVRASQP